MTGRVLRLKGYLALGRLRPKLGRGGDDVIPLPQYQPTARIIVGMYHSQNVLVEMYR